ncbi:hypothetical protein [Halorubrum vacuolatum]|uniref:Uncharacterized protein n=1 Tax=Halorubrum vacuolatum TaxID=63740 RepID=A0A238Y1I3_HALVU|nr:hypothetical protein [Halorubrum vacuolatum]SNR64840.1 hypothetical protein SAMN06264855_12723 [Halorubrum vacuolatum]
MSSEFEPADEPYDIGDIVHIHPSEPEYEHKFGCEIIEVDNNSKPTAPLENHSYTLYSYGVERELESKFPHSQLIPSPRGYPNINDLLGEKSINGEELLGKFKRHDLQLINKYLSSVNVSSDPTLDWLNEIRKGDEDRVNSVFAELYLLYYLREVYGANQVSMNAALSDRGTSKDFDLRLTTDDQDIWIEVTKPDHASLLERGFGFGMRTRTTNSIDRKLKNKFGPARDAVNDDVVLVLAVYQEEKITQGFEIGRWLEEEYYDVGDFLDGWLTFTYCGNPDFEYHPFTENGACCNDVFKELNGVEEPQ